MEEKKILVVDDEEDMRELLRTAFEKKNYRVITAPDAETALEILEHENIQVMFLDLNLPGMNGVELCKHIRKTNPYAIIHAMTGYMSIFELATCREASFDDYFLKPVKIEDLYCAADVAFWRLERWKKK